MSPSLALASVAKEKALVHPSLLLFRRDWTALKLSTIIQRESQNYVSLCPELDVASQGDTVEDATSNLKEALDLLFECAPLKEIQQRLSGAIYASQIEVAVTPVAC